MISVKTICFLIIFSLFIACSKKISAPGSAVIIEEEAPADTISVAKSFDSIQVKYAAHLKVNPDLISNIRLYNFIDNWMYTPYLWGGTTKRGIDCSAFMQRLLHDVYNIDIPRTSVQQFFDEWIERFGSKDYLSEGDLVFFKTMKGKPISHVGLYLTNRMFVNSSSSQGVSIASLDDPYWKQKYVAAGRVRLKKSTVRQ